MTGLIKIFCVILLASSNLAGNIYAKSREVYLLPSKPGKAGRITPRTDKASLDWLIQYDGGVSNYYLGWILPGDTLGIYFEPPAACSLVEVHFCVYRPNQGCSEYYAMVGPAAYDISLLGIWPHSVPGPTPFDTIYIDTVMEIEVMEEFDWDTIIVPFMPDIGTNNFIGAVSPCDTNFSIRIDPGVDPPYHAIGTQGLGWYISLHLYWIRALVRVYENTAPYITMDELDGTYDTGNRLVNIYTEDFDPDTTTLGINEIYLYYFIEGKTDTIQVEIIQDSVKYPETGWEYAWWYAEIPGQPAEMKVTYWVEGTDKGGMDYITSEHWYKVKEGTADYGLLYVEGDNWFGPGTGVHNAFAGQPFDVWNEIFDNIRTIYWVDNTVIDFYVGGPGGRSFSWLSFSGCDLACFTYTQTFRDFMDNGGCIFLAGQDIPGGGYGLGYGEWIAPTSPHPLRDYLKAYAGTDDYILESPFTVTIENTDMLTTGMPSEVTVDCNLVAQLTWIGIFTELDDDCVPFFFDEEGNILGYRYEDLDNNYKVVFLYFPLHAITDTNAQDTLIYNLTSWFELGVEEKPEELVLESPVITPNPLINSATLSFTIPRKEDVVIKIYDITGSFVNTLVSDRYNAGKHTLSLNTDNFASGVYFLRMNIGSLSMVRKFVVVK